MSSHDSTAPAFANLWATNFLVQPIPDAASHNARLAALAEQNENDGVFARANKSTDWLQSHVRHGVAQLLQSNNLPPSLTWGIRAQFQVLRRGDYGTFKNRPGSAFSGLYFITCPARSTTTGRDDLSPGCVSFFDPRPAMNMNAIKQDPYENAEQVLRPDPGLLLIWPSFIRYFVHPILSETPALRVEFDVLIETVTA